MNSTSSTGAEHLMNLLSGKWVMQAVGAAAELGIADALSTPQPLETLAKRVKCPPEPLHRLLRVLVGEGLLLEQRDGHYRLTEAGQHLRAGQLKELVRFVCSPSQWTPWTELADAMRRGECAFERAHGVPLYQHLAQDPEDARIYDEAVDAFTAKQARALATSKTLERSRHVVDVGGGRGTVLLELLTRHPHLQGTLLDRPDVVEAATPRFYEAGLSDRFTAQGGDFFSQLPRGADAYVIKHVLHNWDDERCVRLLSTCRQAMSTDGKVLIVEGLLLPGNVRDLTRLMDLEMLVLTGKGKERSKPEFRALLRQAELRLERTEALTMGAWLLVAGRA